MLMQVLEDNADVIREIVSRMEKTKSKKESPPLMRVIRFNRKTNGGEKRS